MVLVAKTNSRVIGGCLHHRNAHKESNVLTEAQTEGVMTTA